MVDLFEKKSEEKKERVAKNELQRLRNIARGSGMKKVPGIGATPAEKPSKLELGRQFLTAKKVSDRKVEAGLPYLRVTWINHRLSQPILSLF